MTYDIGASDTCPVVLSAYQHITQHLTEPNTIVYVYIIGHGNKFGNEQVYQLPDGVIANDTLTNLLDNVSMDPSSTLVLVCDFCSSGIMLEPSKTLPQHNWINISSCLPEEDSYTSDDGNVMTDCLLDLLQSNGGMCMTTRRLTDALLTDLKTSWVGELQHPDVTVSSEGMWDKYAFCPR